MVDGLTPEDATAIRDEYRRLRTDPATIHNQEMHRRILETWKRESPAMWERLAKLSLTVPMAFVAQQRMWAERDRLVAAGMPITDAREEAEKAHLLLEPEESPEDEAPPR